MTDESWLEISLTVDGELAEAVAEVLARYIPDGVVIEATGVDTSDPEDFGQPVGPWRVKAYLHVDEGLEETRRQVEEALWYLGRIRPLPPLEIQTIQATDWSESWKRHYQPIDVGQRLTILPAWLDPPDLQRLLVRMDPGMAFGTGTHPSTRLCLEFLEADFYPTGQSGAGDFIDIGCGSGILAIAALKLGAEYALGVDSDPQAITIARKNARLNDVSHQLEFGEGSVAEILAGKFKIRRAPLVAANILAPVIIRLLDAGMGELVTPGGRLILAGILAEQAEAVVVTAQQQGLQVVDRRQDGDWIALLAYQPDQQ